MSEEEQALIQSGKIARIIAGGLLVFFAGLGMLFLLGLWCGEHETVLLKKYSTSSQGMVIEEFSHGGNRYKCEIVKGEE